MKEALEWYTTLSLEEKFYQVIPWLKEKGMNATDKHPHSLTGNEIKELYNISKTK